MGVDVDKTGGGGGGGGGVCGGGPLAQHHWTEGDIRSTEEKAPGL